MLLCTCRKEKMATFYSLGPRTSIPCLRRNGQALRTGGPDGHTAKATDVALIGGPTPVLSAWRTRTGAMAGAGDRGMLPTPSCPPHGAQALGVRAPGHPAAARTGASRHGKNTLARQSARGGRSTRLFPGFCWKI
jgi:hypothetical protein